MTRQARRSPTVLALSVILGAACAEEPVPDTDEFPLTITLEPAFTMGSTEDPLTPDLETQFAVTDSFLVVAALPGLLHVFGRDGTFVREINRQGEGPGEFSGRVLPFPRGGGQLLVVDQRTGRHATLDLATDSLHSRGTIMARPVDVVPLRDGWVVTSIGEGGASLHRAFADGSRALLSDGVPLADFQTLGPPVMTVVNGRLVWTPARRFELSVQRPEPGFEVEVLDHVPEFLVEPPEPPESIAFVASVQRLAPAPDGHLWILAVVPTGEEGALEVMFTTWIELLDMESGEVLGRRSVPGVASMTRDGRWLYQFVMADPVPQVRFSSIGIEGD